MTKDELRNIQEQIKMDGPAMATLLEIDYDQYRKYLSGQTKIPDTVASKAAELLHVEAELDRQRISNYEKWLREQPYFISEVSYE